MGTQEDKKGDKKGGKKGSKKFGSRVQFTGGIGNRNARLEMIQLEEADAPLQQFPALLRKRLEDHIRYDGLNANYPVEFWASSSMRLRHFSDGQPARFVVPGTHETLNAGLFRYGTRSTGRVIVVVQQRPGSSVPFNNGEPMIIVYWGKGKKGEARSRYAVWGPDGYRPDIFVDRVLATAPSPPPPASSSAILLQTTNTNQDDDKNKNDNDDDETMIQNPFSLFPHISPPTTQHALSTRPVINPTPRTVPSSRVSFPSIFDDNSDSESEPQTSYRSMSQSSRHSNTAGPSHFHSHPKRTHSPSFNSDSEEPRTTRRKTARDAVIFNFKKNMTDSDPVVTKTLRQCDDVHKLFAYARVARISNRFNSLLSAQVAGVEIVEVVRDDDEDFDKVLRAIREVQENTGDDAVEVVVTEGEY